MQQQQQLDPQFIPSQELFVVFVDDSYESDKAFYRALSLKQATVNEKEKNGAALFIAHCPRQMSKAHKGIIAIQTLDMNMVEGMNQNILEQGKQLLAHYANICREKNVNVETVLLNSNNDPSAAAVEFLKEKKATLALVGSRDLSSFQRFFMSSFSQYLVFNAPCDVLVIRAVASEQQQQQLSQQQQSLSQQQQPLSQQQQPISQQSISQQPDVLPQQQPISQQSISQQPDLLPQQQPISQQSISQQPDVLPQQQPISQHQQPISQQPDVLPQQLPQKQQ